MRFERGVPADAGAMKHAACLANLVRRATDGTPRLFGKDTKSPDTRSGNAILQQLTDDEANALVPGDVVVLAGGLMGAYNIEPAFVVGVRGSVHSNGGEPIAVPVVDVTLLCGAKRVFAVPDLYRPVELDAE